MENNLRDKPLEIAPGIYWVGSCQQVNKLNCNPYLIVDDDEAVLIDPGSPLDFAPVLANVTSIISLDKIKYIILQHQDPDFCASTPLFEKEGFTGSLATHWRAAHLIKYYGVTSPFYIVNEHHLQLTFGQKRTLKFYPTPYLHFPGAITTYDPFTKILFSSDLFGAFSRDWTLFADELEQVNNDLYLEAMKSFHEHYMPSNDILRPAMEKFLQLDIAMIAPQHGSIIRTQVKFYITALRDLECGALLTPLKRELAQINGYTGLINSVLQRYYATFPPAAVAEIFADTHISLTAGNGLISDYNSTGHELWEQFFQYIYNKKGVAWLIFIEPLISRLVLEYNVTMPAIFQSSIFFLEETNSQLNQENQLLRETNQQLTTNLQNAQDSLLKCPLTGLNNEQFFLEYLLSECRSYLLDYPSGSLILVGLDSLNRINTTYSNETGDETIKSAALFLAETLKPNHSLFRIAGPVFAIYLTGANKGTAAQYGEQIRYQFQQSYHFIEPITVSVAIVSLSDFDQHKNDALTLATAIYKVARHRLQTARRQGGNSLCLASELEKSPSLGKVLVVDSDTAHCQVLQQALENATVTVICTNDGDSALKLVQQERPELIISELQLPKIDGFLLKENLRKDSETDKIPFILVSLLKDQESIQRSLMLEIEHYFRKPYFLPELIGLVLLKLRQVTS